MRHRTNRPRRALLLGLALTAAVAAAIYAAASPAGAATGTTVTWTGLGSDNLSGGACKTPYQPADDLSPSPGQEGWLFVLNGLSVTTNWVLTAHFSGGLTTVTASTQDQNQNVHFAVYTPLGAQLLDATATNPLVSTVNNLTLSHCGGGTPSFPDTPGITTTIVGSSAADGIVHDTALVVNPLGHNGAPQGTVSFTWYANGTCSGTGAAAGSAPVGANGLADGSSFEGPLAPGDYSFAAVYASSDTSRWSNAVAACEPLHVAPPTAVAPTASASANPSFDRTYPWTIEKSADAAEIDLAAGGAATVNYTVSVTKGAAQDANWGVTGTISVQNGSSLAVTGATISAAVDPNATCGVVGGTSATLVPGTTTFPFACVYSAAPASASQTLSAGVAWGSQTLLSGYTWLVAGSASASAPLSWATPSTVGNNSVTVADTLAGTLGTTGSSQTYTYAKSFSGVAGTCTSYDNTATIQETGQTSSASVAVCVGADLTVATTAAPSYTRLFAWGIGKDVDQSELHIPAGGTATSSYTVTVVHDSGTDSGWQVSGTVDVTNPNDWESVALTSVADSIDNGGDCTVTGGDSPGALAPGATASFPYACTYASAPAPAFTHSASATWSAASAHTPDGSAGASASGSFAGPTTVANGTASVTDTNGQSWNVSASDPSPESFTYAVARQGVAGTCTDYPNTATLVTDGGATGSASKSVRVCVGEDATISLTAAPAYTRSFAWGIAKSVDATRLVVPDGTPASSAYAVSVTHDAGTDSGWQVGGTITVSNPNDWEALDLSTVTAAIDNGGSCAVDGGNAPGSLAAGQSLTLDYTCTYAAAPSPESFTASAAAEWNAPFASTPDGFVAVSTAGGFAGPTTLVDDSVAVSDTAEGALGSVSTADASPTTFSYTVARAGVPGTCTDYPNVASLLTDSTQTSASADASVTVCVGSDLGVSVTASPAFTRTFAWGIDKSADRPTVTVPAGTKATSTYTVDVSHDAGTDSAWAVSGTITVSNPNDWEPVTLTGVTDAIDNGGVCSLTSGDPNAVLPPGGSVQLGYTCAYESAPSSTSFQDTATATWNALVATTPGSSAAGATVDAFGDPTTVVDGSVAVGDSAVGPLGTVSYTDPSPDTLTYSVQRAGVAGTCTDYPNTASFLASDSSATGSSSASVKVCVARDLTVAKTAATSFTRTYLWSLTKSVDKTLVEQSGGSVKANYTVVAKQTGVADGGWKVAGTITVKNPNDFEPIAATLADSLPGCTLAQTAVTLAPSASQAVAYSCFPTSGAAGTNVATATWDKTVALTPHGSATGSAAYAFGTPSGTTNKTVTVTDAFNGGAASTLGTLTGTDVSPFATKTFGYAHTVSVLGSQCVAYRNTAALSTGQTASASFTVCGENTGALTMGYWQNKNGQALIVGADQAKLGGFLTGYAPFADATAPLAGWVYNVIKAASASGAAMNAMLKGQMLATALSVYFSDPSLGGNKLNAPVPPSGVRIDLLHIPSSGNVSAAFGGATTGTVGFLLAYAAGQSNAGGSSWYGQNKTTQGLAKNTFDAINNQRAPLAP